ncbi:MAG: DUF4328 domain-containing protein [Pseudomonadota bacterium]
MVDLDLFEPALLAGLVSAVYLINLPIIIGCIILVAMWLYRAHASLREMGYETEVSPGWAVGWYFIPLAHLVMPYKSMKDLWNTSFSETGDFSSSAPSAINFWWGCWIVSNMVNWQSTRLSLSENAAEYELSLVLGAVGSAISIAAAYFLIGLIRDITRAQTDGLAAQEVFA